MPVLMPVFMTKKLFRVWICFQELRKLNLQGNWTLIGQGMRNGGIW